MPPSTRSAPVATRPSTRPKAPPGPKGPRPPGRFGEVTLRTSPLDAAHRALGAKMVPFGGWDMPLAYGEGTLAEHRACREAAVAFDVSHLGTVRVEGEGARDALQR